MAGQRILLVTLVTVCLGGTAWAWTEIPDSEPETAKVVWREGDRFAGMGRVEETGDRFVFFPDDDSPSLRLLENLSLERIAWFTTDAGRRGGTPRWQVEGQIFEFRGSFYLLIDRALVKGRTDPLGQLP